MEVTAVTGWLQFVFLGKFLLVFVFSKVLCYPLRVEYSVIVLGWVFVVVDVSLAVVVLILCTVHAYPSKASRVHASSREQLPR